MTNRSLALIAAFTLVACRGQDQAKRSTPNYQVVSEGSASGVTSTINGPGETPAPVTETNVDTTTNFTLPTNPNPLGNSTAGTSVAGSIPSAYTGSAAAPVRRQTQPRTDTQGMTSAPGPVVTDTIGRATPPMPKQTRTTTQSETDTNTTTSTTDTATTTDAQTSTSSDSSSDSNATQPSPKKKKSSKQDDQPPPPPPPTDTTGTRG